MKLRGLVLAILGGVLLATAWSAAPGAPDEKPAVTCPVAGRPINEATSADYREAKVYFCCKGCLAKFQADTDKFATKANHQLVLTKQAKQTACPISGRATRADETLTVANVNVAFCCDGCPKKVTEAAEPQQLELVFGSKGFDKGFAVGK
jgi:YHS domain-containing protein